MNTRHEIHARVHHTPVRQKERGPLLPKPITWNPKSYCWPPPRCTSIISADNISLPPPPHTHTHNGLAPHVNVSLSSFFSLPAGSHHTTTTHALTHVQTHTSTHALSLSHTHTHSLSLHLGGRRGVGSE